MSMVLELADKRLLFAHSGAHTIDDRLFFRDDRTRGGHFMITDLFVHKLMSVLERRRNLRVTRLARRQAHDLPYKQIGTHDRFMLENRTYSLIDHLVQAHRYGRLGARLGWSEHLKSVLAE